MLAELSEKGVGSPAGYKLKKEKHTELNPT